jgi:hypothetical protein
MVSQFFNTAIIILILEATFEGYGVVTAVSYIPTVSMNAKYYDYSAPWFMKIGIKLIITMLIYIVSPNLVEIVMLPFNKCCKRYSSKRKVFQVEMNKELAGPQFDPSMQYAKCIC